MALRTPTVLLLAGDRLTRETTAHCLAAYGYDVVTARDGRDALALLRAQPRTDVLVTDADVTGEVDGLAVAKAARDLNPKIKVIYTARQPHAISDPRKVSGAPIIRTPYFTQQIVGLIGELRNRGAGHSEVSWAA